MINQTLGLHQIFEGKSLALAEVFSPRDATQAVQNEDVLLCMECALDLMAMVEVRNNANS